MERFLLCISIVFMLWGCAQLNHAGNVVLREMSSINVDNPEAHEEAKVLSCGLGRGCG